MKEKEIERLLKSIANRRRIMILNLLRNSKEMSVGEVADKIRLSLRATSKHLSVLANADLLDKEQRSLQVFYSLNKEMPKIAKEILRDIFMV